MMDLVSQVQASNKKLETTLSRAFAFLVKHYHYREEPISYGPGQFRAFTKTFSLGARCIEFSLDYDRKDFFDLLFHPVNFWARSELHRSIKYRPCWHLSLGKALDHLDIDVSLPRTGSVEDVAHKFAEVLREYGTDMIEGDFSVFPPVVFIVEHVKISSTDWSRRTLGEFSTIEEAEQCALAREASFKSDSNEHIEIIGRVSEPEQIN